jgi:Tfp pilus assembly protein PilN
MIQFNLLPDIKLEFIKAKRSKRLVMMVSFLAVAISIGILILMLAFNAFQKSRISALTDDIKEVDQRLQDVPDLARILTIQNQLNTLPSLYAQRPAASRLSGYLQQTTPTSISISQFKVNFEESTAEITGSSDSLESINQYVDTLKFTKYTVDTDTTEVNAFSEVVLTSFSRSSSEATFKVNMKIDPTIFDDAKEIKLVVPQTVTTRSETELPTGIFETGEEQ